VGGITVYPGDLLHGDRNGVTTIPHEIAHDVAHAGTEFVAAEEVVLSCLRSGTATLETFREARAECGRRIEEMRQRLRRG
jgi:regulator of RNase E activity RraA